MVVRLLSGMETAPLQDKCNILFVGETSRLPSLKGFHSSRLHLTREVDLPKAKTEGEICIRFLQIKNIKIVGGDVYENPQNLLRAFRGTPIPDAAL